MGGRTSIKVSLETIMASAKYTGDYDKPEYCNVPNCARPATCMSLCKAHYHYWQRARTGQGRTRPDYDEVLKYVQPKKNSNTLTTKERVCRVPNCRGRYEARGLCTRHYARYMVAIKRENNDGTRDS